LLSLSSRCLPGELVLYPAGFPLGVLRVGWCCRPWYVIWRPAGVALLLAQGEAQLGTRELQSHLLPTVPFVILLNSWLGFAVK